MISECKREQPAYLNPQFSAIDGRRLKCLEKIEIRDLALDPRNEVPLARIEEHTSNHLEVSCALL